MNYEEEIGHRKTIMSRISSGEKISPEERLWLVTHPLYNSLLGYPYLNFDIIDLSANADYHVQIKVEKITYPGRILPVITVPGGKGEIVSNMHLFNYKGEAVPSGKPVKMLVLEVHSEGDEAEFDYRSSLGLIGVSFQCEYFNDEQGITIRQNSNTGTTDFAMLREFLSDNKVVYRCKPPKCGSFESFVFSVEWIKSADAKVK